MFSTITIISIFIEIFTAGLLISGGMTLLWKYFNGRQLKDLFFALALFSLFSHVFAVIASQLMLDLGVGLADLIQAQKWVFISLVLASFFIWLFTIEKFKIKFGHLISVVVMGLSGAMIYAIVDSTTNLVYREGVVEPIVFFSSWVAVKPFFAVILFLLGLGSLVSAISAGQGKRSLPLLTASAASLLMISLYTAFLYGRFGEAGYLLCSWGLFLLSVISFILGEVIPSDSPEAKAPLRFFQTRIIFKLMLIFVVIIVVLFEATTLATINISKGALSKSIKAKYLKNAQSLAEKIETFNKTPTTEELQASVQKIEQEEGSIAFIVDGKGVLLAHPDRKRAEQKEDLKTNEIVARLLTGERGAGEFHDELGSAIVGAYVPIKKYGWGAVVQEPLDSAYFEMRLLESYSLMFLMAGLFISALAGIFFARSIEKPIKALTLGTEAVSQGKLGYNISVDSHDEIGKLAAAFNQMTRELRDSQERLILSEKLASLGTMAAGMAHEIKNPLVSLRTFTQLLQQKWDDKEFREKFSAIIPHEIERINKIAESLLKFGRPMKPELTKVDINALLDEVLMLFESECKKYNVVVTKKMAELPLIPGDPGQLSQAFVNIIKNGIESMQAKGGELLVKTDVGEVVKLGKSQGRQGVRKGEEFIWGEESEGAGQPVPAVFIEVTDSGEGIKEGNLKSLFDPFFTTKMTGTGMGLPITLRIIEEHRGSIKVRSWEGRGTTFVISLPQKY